MNEAEANRHERSLRNTFGWMRIEILTMLIAGIFLGAFCFSLLVEAVQTLVHIENQDTMHLPVAVFSLGCGGLILNAFCYLMIGGYTHHQGSFLHITPTGDVVLDQVVSDEGLCRGGHRLSKSKHNDNTNQTNGITQSAASSIQIDVPTDSTKQSSSIQITARKHTFGELMRDISSMYTLTILKYLLLQWN